jgi:hypothetical protein
MKTLLASLLLVGALATQAPGPAAVTGDWSGTLDAGGQKLHLAIHVTETADGAFSAKLDSLDQGAIGLPIDTIRLEGRTLSFQMAALAATFHGTVSDDGQTIAGTFQQGPAQFPLTFGRTAQAVPAAPAGTPPPYRVEDVTYRNGAVTLAATLTIPQGKGPFPAVVMATGSGPQNRDEELFGFKVFGVIADYLTRHGVAVLSADDRGVGGSSGPVATATTADFAEDALAGVTWLAARPEIDRARIGVFGHSEGGDIAFLAAQRSTGVAFIVSMAGPAVPGETGLAAQQADGARQIGATAQQIATEQAAFHAVVDAVRAHADTATLRAVVRTWLGTQYDWLPPAVRAQVGDRDAFLDKQMPAALAQMTSSWMQYELTFDPATALRALHCPVLALFGGKDTQVPADTNRPALERALALGGNTHVTTKTYPDANHLFITAVTGQASEYSTLPKTFVPGFLEDVTAWIVGPK